MSLGYHCLVREGAILLMLALVSCALLALNGTTNSGGNPTTPSVPGTTTAVLGLPLNMDGSEGPQAARVRSAATRLAGFLRVPIEFADERLSSSQASKAMHEAGASSRDQRGRLDMVAASLFLQSYLDARRQGGRIGEEA